MKAIVVDDERYTLDELRDLVETIVFVKQIRCYDNPVKAYKEAIKFKPDIAFVDIEMPVMSGMELAEKLNKINPVVQIIFVTAYSQYAVKAFEVNALDYLLKPINIERFNKMIKKIQSKQNIILTSNIVIKTFNKMEVYINNRLVKWERAKALELFAYLLMNYGKLIHKDVLIDTLWNNYEPKKAIAILQTSIWKIRNVFKKAKNISIDYQNSSYCLNIREIDCDYIQLNEVLENFSETDTKAFKPFITFVKNFSGFLSQEGYLWALNKEEELKVRILSKLNYLSHYYYDLKEYRLASIVLKIIVKLVPYEEQGNNMLLKCLVKMNEGAEMINYYNRLKKILKEDYDLLPASSTRELYNKLMKDKYLD